MKNPKMCPKTLWAAAAILLLAIWTPAPAQNNQAAGRSKVTADDDSIDANALKTIDQGRQTFRFETFGDETFWGTTIKLHQAVATLSPKKVLALGLKVDADALPKKLRNQLKHGALNLDDPANTAALLKLNAVVRLTGFFDGSGNLNSIGTQCALCHSTVDNSLAPGIGKRLDGWPNRDLNIGAIIASAPDLSSVATLLGVDQNTVREVLNAWGPGNFDAELFLDGKGFRPDGATAAVLIPPDLLKSPAIIKPCSSNASAPCRALEIASLSAQVVLGAGSTSSGSIFIPVQKTFELGKRAFEIGVFFERVEEWIALESRHPGQDRFDVINRWVERRF